MRAILGRAMGIFLKCEFESSVTPKCAACQGNIVLNLQAGEASPSAERENLLQCGKSHLNFNCDWWQLCATLLRG
jgi:hypothetical protein